MDISILSATAECDSRVAIEATKIENHVAVKNFADAFEVVAIKQKILDHVNIIVRFITCFGQFLRLFKQGMISIWRDTWWTQIHRSLLVPQ